ncbi:hypothetical protein [Glycomyces dulcitolivorans]|jgi:hypothetical protein|uniref:hypothetical protein n=1 Tax=Glycomyces dulcitolivorans TaxID=2200759 RepID=UPI000DD3058E|nr:hypothetical protein [Glycomyces dulcitolivorans]
MSATKIGTAEFGGRVISGFIPQGESGSVMLRQLYPQPPVDIGVIDQIEGSDPQLTLSQTHCKGWSDACREALKVFFADRFREHARLAALLGIAAVLGEAANGRE